MLKSMTGYGRGEHAGQARLYILEAQALNHRFLEVRARVPKRLLALEHRVQAAVQERFARGRFDLTLIEKELAERPRSLRLNKGLAAQYLAALKSLQEELRLPGQLTIEHLAAQRDLFEIEEEEVVEEAWGEVEVALARALDALEAMRIKEGEALEGAIRGYLDRVEALVEGILRRAPQLSQAHKERLQERLAGLLGGRPVDPSRLEQELAILADRSDISEEGARLKSHLGQFRAMLAEAGPHGRRLEFLLQEMNREANTIGAKAADALISQEVVAVKAELERIREQVQNVE